METTILENIPSTVTTTSVADARQPNTTDNLMILKVEEKGEACGKPRFVVDSDSMVNDTRSFSKKLSFDAEPVTADKLVNKSLFDGKTWTLQYDGTVVVESDRVGQHYIQQLIQSAKIEKHVTGLVTGTYGESDEVMDAKDLLESGVAITEADENEIADGVD